MRNRSFLDGLRREGRAFSVLAALLLFVQLLLTGANGAAMAAEHLSAPDLTVLCHVGDEGEAASSGKAPSEHERAPCPCLAGACTPMAGLPVATTAALEQAVAKVAGASAHVRYVLAVDRRPLALFGRAGQSPPTG